ncbi:MAG: GDP-mannose dehydrogenase, partial [Chloroflexi bacterium]|nr:GDP-mannose dehydrogenase [Chloroflexota bacterium]
SNERHLDRIAGPIIASYANRIGVVGLVFKSGTDDVRESPAVKLVRRLIDAGKEVMIYEPEIDLARLNGANLEYLTSALPEYEGLLTDWETASANSDALVIARKGAVGEEQLQSMGLPIFDVETLGMVKTSPSAVLSAI